MVKMPAWQVLHVLGLVRWLLKTSEIKNIQSKRSMVFATETEIVTAFAAVSGARHICSGKVCLSALFYIMWPSMHQDQD
jgi:hypothetical protein